MKEKQRKIIHIDMDCYFAAIEERDFPELKGKPMAIGGGERGVLSTANYEARKFGVHSALPIKVALQKCPHLILRDHRPSIYKEDSIKIRKIFSNYTDLIEPLSLDEAFLDVSQSMDYSGSATWIAQAIRKDILQTTGLTASAGVAPNKFLAKVASDWNKPNGVFVIKPDEVLAFVTNLPVKKIFGVGPKAAEKMERWNIRTCGDIQAWSKDQLEKVFGSWALQLYNLSRGIDPRKVSPGGSRKSLSVEHTFNTDIIDIDDCFLKMQSIYKELDRREQKQKKQLPIKTIFVKVKYFDFQVHTIDKAYTKKADFSIFKELFLKAFAKREEAVRLIGFGYRYDKEDNLRSLQMDFFSSNSI